MDRIGGNRRPCEAGKARQAVQSEPAAGEMRGARQLHRGVERETPGVIRNGDGVLRFDQLRQNRKELAQNSDAVPFRSPDESRM